MGNGETSRICCHVSFNSTDKESTVKHTCILRKVFFSVTGEVISVKEMIILHASALQDLRKSDTFHIFLSKQKWPTRFFFFFKYTSSTELNATA